jgi:ABC-type phosphate transport system permease subunit
VATPDQVKARRILISVAAVVLGVYGALVLVKAGATSRAEIIAALVVVVVAAPFILRYRRRMAAEGAALRASRPLPPPPKRYR